MKCVGMLLIVWGHSGGLNILDRASTFHYKQLGVAFFVFVMGFTLAGEARPALRVLYNRLFEVYLFGGLFAIVMSVIAWFTIGDLQESNYLPLAFGVNVVFDNFPANPTTWYIGTYLHLLLLWAIALRRIPFRWWMIVPAIVGEVVIRAALMDAAGNYVAYMLLSNWLGVFLLGQLLGRQALHEDRTLRRLPFGSLAAAGILAAAVLAWWTTGTLVGSFERRDHFRLLPLGDETSALVATSATISLGYLLFTWLMYETARRLPASAIVEFFARNTLIVFIVHMPLIYALTPRLYPLVSPGPLRILLNTACFYVAPALFSELIRRVLAVRKWREFLLLQLQARLRPA